MAKILIIADITPSSGLGHWMRCYNLAHSLADEDVIIHALKSPFMQTCDFFMPTEFIQWHCTNIDLNDTDIIKLVEILYESHQFNAVLIDGYEYSTSYRSELRKVGVPVIAYDDINNSPEYHCDLLINSNAHAENLNYSASAPKAKLLLGSQYRHFAKVYYLANEQLIAESNWHERTSLTIVMGGNDIHSLTLPLLQTLLDLDWSGKMPSIQVITTAMHANLSMIHQWCEEYSNITVHHHEYDLSAVFASARLAISGAGGTAYELQMCATPAMLINLADNQNATAEEATRMGWAESWNWQDNADITELAKQIHGQWLDEQTLRNMHNKLLHDHKLFASLKLKSEIMSFLEA